MLISVRTWLILPILLGISGICQAQTPALQNSNSFRHAELGFILSWPEDFEQVQTSGEPAVALALRKKGADFPTFNIISQAGSFDPNRDTLQQQAKVVRSNYRALGLEAVKISEKKLIEVGSGMALRIGLDYKNQGTPFRSVVVLAPGKMRHFILTYLDRTESFEASQPALNRLLETFELPDHVRSSGKADSFPPVWLVVGILLILVLLFRLKRKRSA